MTNVKLQEVCKYSELFFNEMKSEIYLILELCTGKDILSTLVE